MKFNANVTTNVLDLQLKIWMLKQPKMADTPPKAMESSVAQESRQPVWNMALSTWKYDFCPRRSLIKLHDRLSLFEKLLAWTKQNHQECFRIVVVTGCSWSSSGWSLLIQSTGTNCPLKHSLQWSHRLEWRRGGHGRACTSWIKSSGFFCQEPPEVLYVEAPTLYTT